eukprot:scaffold1650_cov351-Prasinococcus_capsulatus_cf.AAC.20
MHWSITPRMGSPLYVSAISVPNSGFPAAIRHAIRTLPAGVHQKMHGNEHAVRKACRKPLPSSGVPVMKLLVPSMGSSTQTKSPGSSAPSAREGMNPTTQRQ